jgi:hypothetical protein
MARKPDTIGVSNAVNVTFDDREFQRRMKLLARKVGKQAAVKGMGQAVMNLLRDAIQEPPTAPIKDGWLRGSGSCFVGRKFVTTAEEQGYDRAKTGAKRKQKPTRSHSEPIGKDELIGLVGFNVPYAARWHEYLPSSGAFSEPSAGTHYLSSKLAMFGKDYFKVIADEIGKVMR